MLSRPGTLQEIDLVCACVAASNTGSLISVKFYSIYSISTLHMKSSGAETAKRHLHKIELIVANISLQCHRSENQYNVSAKPSKSSVKCHRKLPCSAEPDKR